MSDRVSKPRADRDLPAGYQFGDARPPIESLEGATLTIDGKPYVLGPPIVFPSWRAASENAAERLNKATMT